jgi:hypothetical protein
MIHILTIHWQSEDWIDLQLKYLDLNIDEPYRVYSFLNNVPNSQEHKKKFFYTSTENIKSHPIKLNLLADIASFASEDENDILIFLDGDAFPIKSISKFKKDIFPKYRLAAIQRLENNGDIQPHPCFCMTTVKFWNQIEGDWKEGNVKWTDKFGKKVWDVGGQMLKIMNDLDEDWFKLTRTNQHDLHPLLFGIYGDLIYHHGAAFRNPGTRVDKNQVVDFNQRLSRFKRAKKYMPKILARKLFLPLKYQVMQNDKNSKNIYKSIIEDNEFYKKLENHDE